MAEQCLSAATADTASHRAVAAWVAAEQLIASGRRRGVGR
jgi:hypothetical protein